MIEAWVTVYGIYAVNVHDIFDVMVEHQIALNDDVPVREEQRLATAKKLGELLGEAAKDRHEVGGYVVLAKVTSSGKRTFQIIPQDLRIPMAENRMLRQLESGEPQLVDE